MNRIPEAIQNLDVVLGVDPGNAAARQMMEQIKGQAR